MSRAWRLVWLCLLAFAMPLQGMAAAAMVHCESSHERMHAEALRGHERHMAPQAAHHHDASMQSDDAAGASTPAANNGDKLSSLAQHHCSACSACCSAVTLPATWPGLPAALPVLAPAADPFQPLVAHLTDGPERPPRALLA